VRCPMDHLWSPWRFRYVTEPPGAKECPFCEMIRCEPARDREQLILHRARLNFVFLNLYPYATGHLLIAPYAHVANLDGLEDEAMHEMICLARKGQQALEAVYHPEGYNLGMNLGRCAGAGITNHVHLHLLPRWVGDANFMSVVSETRVLPEELSTTYDKLVSRFAQTGRQTPHS
ncbi:MAG: HIT family protein, partial [Terriglobia bacterium]